MGISNEDYDTIIARARNILKNGAIAKFIFDVRTTHHHKGSEVKYVILVDGFVPLFDEIGCGMNKNLTEEELYIVFTAMTCAMERLYLPKSIYDDFKRLRFYFASEEKKSSKGS